jgi:hypothetical protein
MKMKAGLPVAVALVISLLTPSAGHAAPVISRSHLDFPVVIDECGIGTLDLSIDAFNLVQLASTADGGLRGTFTTVDRGTGVDAATGATYRFVDRFTQTALLRLDQPFVNTAERTLRVTGSAGGILARAVVHNTVLPSGEVRSDLNVQYVRCL